MKAARTILIAGLLLAAAAYRADAQNWPTRPVAMVVPFPAGSGSDAIARIFARSLPELLGAQVIVENVGGAGGMSAGNRVAKAAPDGYQFMLGTTGTHALNQTLYKKPLYDAAGDFAPVALLVEQPTVLVARRELNVGNLREFIAHAQANQAKMQFGSGGVGSITHLACALFNSAIGANVTHVPYRGAVLALQDMIAARIDYACPIASITVPQVEGGQVKAIAILSKRRSPTFPNLATAREQGLDLEPDEWVALFMPKGTPAPIVQRLNAATVAAMNTPDVQQQLRAAGTTIVAPERRSPDYLAAFVRDEVAKWATVIKAAGVSAD
jgi:tripartite-type tricarboxylate transporter receptor subunit TctC